MSENITVTIRMSNSSRFSIGSIQPFINSSNTVLELKQIIANQESSGRCPVERQRLIHKGRILNDDSRTLADYGIAGDDQTVYLVKSANPSLSSNSPSTNQTSSTSSTSAAEAPFSLGGTGNASPFSRMQEMMQQQGGAFPPGAREMQQELLQNPEMARSLMNSPMMQNLMSNPDLIRTMMDSNPQMREVLNSNPELRNLLDDPEMMSRSMEMMRDPNAMQNMMRNQDLAMSQIENIPGGFSALRRMYEDVQEPMINALSNSNNTGNGGTSATNSSNTSSSGSGAAGMAMPNPWANSTAGRSTSTTTAGTAPSPSPMFFPENPSSSGGQAPNGMNMEQTISMLENPVINQMMSQMMADPAALQSMMENNPMLRQMRETNPQVASMISNPEMMRAMMNPQNLRALNQMQNAMQQLGHNVPGFPTPSLGTNATPSSPNQPALGNSGMDFSSLLNQFQTASVSSSAGASAQQEQIPPEQRYRMQLQSLNDMGFDDNQANIRALTQTHGNVNRAVDVLLTAPVAVEQTTTSTSFPTSAPSTSSDNSPGNHNSNESSDKKND